MKRRYLCAIVLLLYLSGVAQDPYLDKMFNEQP